MGFFSDLKEDLSQAVNELMPEDALDAALAGDAEAKEALTEDKTAETVDSVDLISMLDKLEDLDTANDTLEEELVLPDSLVDDTVPSAESETEPEMMPEEADLTEEEVPEPEMLVVPETEPEPEMIAEPEPEMIPEPEAAAEPEIEPEPEPAAEPELAGEPEVQSDNIIEGLSGEEEEIMDAQTQTQEQTQVQEPINRVAVDETAVVTEGMTITGDIVSAGSMELIGTVNGNLDIYGKLNITGTIQGDSKAAEIYAEGAKITGEVHSEGSVKIGQSSVVIGNISAASAVVAGAVKGDIDVQGPVILDTTAIVMGNIKSKSVQINNGAVIEGLCSQCYADVNPSSFFEEFKKKK